MAHIEEEPLSVLSSLVTMPGFFLTKVFSQRSYRQEGLLPVMNWLHPRNRLAQQKITCKFIFLSLGFVIHRHSCWTRKYRERKVIPFFLSQYPYSLPSTLPRSVCQSVCLSTSGIMSTTAWISSWHDISSYPLRPFQNSFFYFQFTTSAQ